MPSARRSRMSLEDVAEEVLNGLFCHYEPPVTEEQKRQAKRDVRLGRSSSFASATDQLRTPVSFGSRSQSKSILRTSRSFQSKSSHSTSRSVTWRDQNRANQTEDVDQRVAKYAMEGCGIFRRQFSEEPEESRQPSSLHDTVHIQGRRNSGDSPSSRRSGRRRSPKSKRKPGYIQTTPTRPQPKSGPPKRILYDDEGNPINEDSVDPADENDPLQMRSRHDEDEEQSPTPLTPDNEEVLSPNAPSPSMLNPFCGFGEDCWPRLSSSKPLQVSTGVRKETVRKPATPVRGRSTPTRRSPARRTRSPSPSRRRPSKSPHSEESEEEPETEESDVEEPFSPISSQRSPRMPSRVHRQPPPRDADEEVEEEAPAEERIIRRRREEHSQDDNKEAGEEEPLEKDKSSRRSRSPGRKWYKPWRRQQASTRRESDYHLHHDDDGAYTSDNEGSIINKLGRAVRSPARRFRSRSKSPSSHVRDDSVDSGIVDQEYYGRNKATSSPGRRFDRRSSNATSAAIFRPGHPDTPVTPRSYASADPHADEYNIGYSGSFDRRARSPDFDEDGMRHSREGRHSRDRGSAANWEDGAFHYDDRTGLDGEDARRRATSPSDRIIQPTTSEVECMSPRTRRRWRNTSNGWVPVNDPDIDDLSPASQTKWRNLEVDGRRGSFVSSHTNSPTNMRSYPATREGFDSPLSPRIQTVRSSERRSRRSFDSSFNRRPSEDEIELRASPSGDAFDPEFHPEFAKGGKSYGNRRRRVSDPLPVYHSSRGNDVEDARDDTELNRRRLNRARSPGGVRHPDSINTDALAGNRGFRDPTPRHADPIISSQDRVGGGFLPPTPRRDFSSGVQRDTRRYTGRPETPVMDKLGPSPRPFPMPPRQSSANKLSTALRNRPDLRRTLSPTSLTATLDTEKEIREDVSSVGMESNTIRPLIPNPFMTIPPDIVPSQPDDDDSEGSDEDPSTLSSDPAPSKAATPLQAHEDSGSGSGSSSKKRLFGGLRRMKFGKVKAIARDIEQNRLPSPGGPLGGGMPLPSPRKVRNE